MDPVASNIAKYVVGVMLFLVWLATTTAPPVFIIDGALKAAIFAAAWAFLGLGAYQGTSAVKTNWMLRIKSGDVSSSKKV